LGIMLGRFYFDFLRRAFRQPHAEGVTVEIESYDKVERTVTIEGTPGELKALSDEMQRWTPTGGWSREARELFSALEKAD
jgi:hypothetical protein